MNADPDLFGRRKDLEEGVVASTIFDEKELIGVNRNFPTYTTDDYRVAVQLRRYLINKYPGIMNTRNIGGIPNNAAFHAEATLLLRAAQANGGTLAGKTLEVLVDDRMCNSCKEILPYIGLALDNPTVTFTELTTGVRRTMRNGAWVD